MRIDELRLIAFGPFTDTVLDLSGGKEGFHLIYGPNEAGKSSALRALRYLLYGIHPRSTDNFLHPHPKMRIGATLQSGSGEILKFIRRKGRSNTLRGPDDETMVEENLLRRFIGGIDAELFSTMFGIGYEDLVRGGQDIIEGGGDVGRLVFSAGSGIANLLEIQTELQANADELFRPSGQKQKINEALIQLNHSRLELKSIQLKANDWCEHDKMLRKAIERKEMVQLELNVHQKKLNRLQRIQQALPLIAERKDLESALKHYAGAVLLPEEFPEKRRDLVSRLSTAQNRKEQSLGNIEAYNKTISGLFISHELLDSSDIIEDIHLELGSQNKAVKDRVQLETKRSGLLAEAREILKNLDDNLTIEEAEKRRIKKTEALKIRKLGAEYERIVTRREDAKKKLPEIMQEMDEIKKELDLLPAPRSLEALKQTVLDAEEYGAQEKQNRSEQSEIESLLKSIEMEQARLGLKEKSFREIRGLALPLPETIRIFEEQFDANDRVLNQIKGELKKVQSALQEVEGQIETNRLAHEVPTEEDLLKARELRDMGWKLVAGILAGESISEETIGNFVANTPNSETLSEAFEIRMAKADHITDRLRREAGLVAEKAMLLTQKNSLADQLRQLEKELEITKADREKLTTEWAKLWVTPGIHHRSPREMAQWINDFKILVQKLMDLWNRQTKNSQLQSVIDAHRERLVKHLEAMEIKSDQDRDSLAVLIKKARSFIGSEEELLRKREQFGRDYRKLENEHKSAESRLESSEKDLSDWQVQWEKAVRPIGLNGDAQPEEANLVMDELKNLFEKIREAEIIKKRINGIDRDREEFIQRVKSLAEVVAHDLSKRAPSETALELHHRLKQSREALTKKETLEKQMDQEHERLHRAIQDITELESRLKAMCEEAGCGNIDELPEAEQRSGKRREISSRLESADGHLRGLSGGVAVETFIKEALEIDPDSIAGEIRNLEETVDQLNSEKEQLIKTITIESSELQKMDGSGKAAELAEKIQITLAGIEKNAEQYARLKIASKVLSMAIERYRDKSQGPILTRASLLFNQITGGAFESIRAEYDDKGKPVIVGIRSRDREIVHVEGMSDGTSDQLYLALRLAGLEMYMKNSEPIPFIVDDILIKFDNDRAAAALKVLAKISEKTQMIFFTHHHHLVQLANKHIDPAILFHHNL